MDLDFTAPDSCYQRRKLQVLTNFSDRFSSFAIMLKGTFRKKEELCRVAVPNAWILIFISFRQESEPS